MSIVYRENPSTGLSEGKVNKENPSASLNGKKVDKADPSTGLSERKVDKKNPPAGLSEDWLNMNPNSILDHLSAGTKAVGQRKISLESYDLKAETATRWKLPGRLEEISGLAMTLDNRLMAHNDEKAVIREIDYRNGVIVKAFQLADMKAPVNGDFEGIATVNDQVYLVTSSGRIYEGSRGAEGESVLYNSYATGVGRDYEIEGLAYDATQRVLLLMCKDARRADLKEQLVLYRWSLDKKQLIRLFRRQRLASNRQHVLPGFWQASLHRARRVVSQQPLHRILLQIAVSLSRTGTGQYPDRPKTVRSLRSGYRAAVS